MADRRSPAHDDVRFAARLPDAQRAVLLALPLVLLATVLLARPIALARPTLLGLAVGAEDLTPEQLTAAAADALDDAVTSGTGVTFEIVQHSTIAARAGGPLVSIPHPTDRGRSLGEADRYALATYLEHDTWGAPTVRDGSGTVLAWDDAGSLKFRYLYVGAFGVAWDELGLGLEAHHMGVRHYSPALGRFLQPDPSALEANLYAYAENGPITKVDPSGEIAWCAIPLIGWAACAAGARLVLWGGSAFANWLGSMLVRSGPALTSVPIRKWLGACAPPWRGSRRRSGPR